MEEGQKETHEQTVTIKKSDLWKYSTFLLIAVVIIGAFFMLSGNGGSGSTGAVTDTGSEQQEPIEAMSLIESDDPVIGDPNAKITILEFSDFQCPFCARAFEGAVTDFKNSNYFKNGEVNLMFKQFPLNSIHPYAQKAGEASLCANEQGKFWEYHDYLFTHQTALAVTDLKAYAKTLGLNTQEFNSCLDSGDFASEVAKETAQAASVGGQGTPFFVIVNTETEEATAISGAYPWTQFEAAIQSIQ